jgi:hypothetical protein
MAEPENQEIAPEDTGETVQFTHVKGRKAFSKLRRELSDEELSSPAVQRLLIDDIERLEKENGKLSDYQDRYYAAETRAAVLNEKLKTNVAQDVIFGVCLTVGAALIGLAPSLWLPDKPHGWISVALGVTLVIGGIASKVVKR